MIKRLLGVITLTLAINFIAALGGVGWLWKSGALSRDKIHQLKEVLYPSTATAPTTAPDETAADANAATQPVDTLAKLMSGIGPRSASEQLDFISNSFDSQMAIIDRRQVELTALQRQIEASRQQVETDRAAVAADRAKLTADQDAVAKQAQDTGFQTTLALYEAMPPAQVKSLFMNMDPATVARYLSAMEPRSASKIVKTFKSNDEIDRIQKVMALIQSPDATGGASAAGNGGGPNAAGTNNAGAAGNGAGGDQGGGGNPLPVSPTAGAGQ